jgi:hypothetical protein
MIVRWKQVKAGRGPYFVEYIPAPPGNYLATLVLTYVGDAPDPEIAKANIQEEFELWIRKFPVPLMASAIDNSGNGINFSEQEYGSYMTGYADGDRIVSKWGLHKDCDIPEHLRMFAHRANAYKNLEAVTMKEGQADQSEQRKIMRTGWCLVFVWAVVIPVVIAILGFLNIFYVGALALLYSLYKATGEALKMFGMVGHSKKEKETADLEMRHHHYHCKRNPEGFIRLRNENYRNDEKAEIQRDSQELIHTKKQPNGEG